MKDKSAFQQKIKLLTKLFDFGCNTEKNFRKKPKLISCFLIWEVVLMNSRLRSNDASRSEDTETTGGAR